MASATFDLNELKRRMHGAVQVFKQELGGLRTGRASSSLLDHVQAEAYGTHMPLNQLATISVPEPRLITVQVWDKSMVHAVEKAISAANLGLTIDGIARPRAPILAFLERGLDALTIGTHGSRLRGGAAVRAEPSSRHCTHSPMSPRRWRSSPFLSPMAKNARSAITCA